MTTLPPSLWICLTRGGYSRVDIGAGNRIRTGDLNLGKVALYQLSYSRNSRMPSSAGWLREGAYFMSCAAAVKENGLHPVIS